MNTIYREQHPAHVALPRGVGGVVAPADDRVGVDFLSSLKLESIVAVILRSVFWELSVSALQQCTAFFYSALSL